MKYLLLIFLFSLGCAKSNNPVASDNIYFSDISVINGIDTPCNGCLTLELQGRGARFSYSNNAQESCASEGTNYYLAEQGLIMPTVDNPQVTWNLSITTNSNDLNCFPDDMTVYVDYLGDNPYYVQVTYAGRSYKLKKP